jgi:D-serine dehydratase
MAGSEVGNHLMVRQQAARIDSLQPVWLLVTCAVGSGPGDVSLCGGEDAIKA